MRNITLIYPEFEEEHLGKDLFLVPYYLGKSINCNVKIVYPLSKTNKYLPKSIRGVELCPFRYPFTKGGRKIFTILSFMYLLLESKKIDILISFHIVKRSAILVNVYKLLNSKGIVYVKMDVPMFIIDEIEKLLEKKGVSGKLNRLLFLKFYENTNLFSCETQICHKRLSNLCATYHLENKIVLMPNGFDEEERVRLNIPVKSYNEKENLMITVGRLGTHQKNTEMLMEAITDIDLINWKIILIGSIETSFQSYIKRYFIKNPNLIDKVIFTGPIYDKSELWNYFSRAKVFILTSRWESFGLVLNEAKRFNDYIISTDVGIAKEIIDERTGCIIVNESVSELNQKLNQIIGSKMNINVNKYQCGQDETIWSDVIKKISLKSNE